MSKYTFFWSGPFSNWHSSRFIMCNKVFRNSEQAFMWLKAMEFNDTKTAQLIIETSDPRKAKDLGRTVKGYKDSVWSEKREEAMFKSCLEKFRQNDNLKKLLLENTNYVEASPYDKIWGIGMKEGEEGIEDPKNWKGQNLLGKVLNRVREAILNDTTNI